VGGLGTNDSHDYAGETYGSSQSKEGEFMSNKSTEGSTASLENK